MLILDLDPMSSVVCGLLSVKTPLYEYKDSHYKDKTVVRPSYLYNGNSYTDKTINIF